MWLNSMASHSGKMVFQLVFNTGFTVTCNNNVLPVDIHTLYQTYAVYILIYMSILPLYTYIHV